MFFNNSVVRGFFKSDGKNKIMSIGGKSVKPRM